MGLAAAAAAETAESAGAGGAVGGGVGVGAMTKSSSDARTALSARVSRRADRLELGAPDRAFCAETSNQVGC